MQWPIVVNFGGGRGEAVAKAVGIKGAELPSVIDATAGLGRDAFVLASIGCQVRLVERHPVVYLLLQDGLNRAYQDVEIGEMMQKKYAITRCSSYCRTQPTNRECRCGVFRSNVSAQTKICPSQKRNARIPTFWLVQIWMPMSS